MSVHAILLISLDANHVGIANDYDAIPGFTRSNVAGCQLAIIWHLQVAVEKKWGGVMCLLLIGIRVPIFHAVITNQMLLLKY